MDGIAIGTLILSFATAVVAMALPLAYPTTSPEIWRTLLWGGVIVFLISAVYLTISKLNLRGKKAEGLLEMKVAQGGKGGSGEIFGSGIVIAGDGGRVGAGGTGRGGDGGSGVVRGDGVIIGGQGGAVDGTHVWYPPAASPLERLGGSELNYGSTNYGQGGMSGSYLEKFNIVGQIRNDYFLAYAMPGKINASKIGDVPLDYLNDKLQEQGYPWRARIEGRWYLFFIP
jgi:hypothetical protein